MARAAGAASRLGGSAGAFGRPARLLILSPEPALTRLPQPAHCVAAASAVTWKEDSITNYAITNYELGVRLNYERLETAGCCQKHWVRPLGIP